MKKRLFLITLLSSFFVSYHVTAQEQLSADELFQQARKAAFDKKNYPEAIMLSKEALRKSPDYPDIGIFLGRLYTWSHFADSAREQLSDVLLHHPDNEDAAGALTDLEYWNGHDTTALRYCEQGLQYHPHSQGLLLKKARILNHMREYHQAYTIANDLLKINPKNAEARSLAESIKNNGSPNKLGVSYDYVHFSKNYPSSTPWQLVSIDYSRSTKAGSIIGWVNYANRFKMNGIQAEINAYPHISKIFYCYLDAGYSNNLPVFPTWRGGFSLYANLPGSLEGEAGFRYLYFSTATWIYTASVGKYYKNWWFNLRTYLIPDNSGLSNSYTLTTRYYFGGADDYIAGAIGTGISPDDKANNIQLSDKKLMAKKVSVEYRRTFHDLNIWYISGTYIQEDLSVGTKGNQFDIGIGYQRRF
jgi:YaiO family outer membrane protein